MTRAAGHGKAERAGRFVNRSSAVRHSHVHPLGTREEPWELSARRIALHLEGVSPGRRRDERGAENVGGQPGHPGGGKERTQEDARRRGAGIGSYFLGFSASCILTCSSMCLPM